MKLNIRSLPKGVPGGGYAYILAFDNGAAKVGMSTNPASRVPVHVYNARQFGAELTDYWVSPPHQGFEATEQALIDIARALSPEPVPDGARREWFTNVDFALLVGSAEQLSLNVISGPAIVPVPEERRARPARTIQVHPPRRFGSPFADLIRKSRHEAGLTQDMVVALSGVAKSTLVRWEGGRAERPEPEHVRALCVALEISPVKAAIALGFLTAEDVAAVHA